MKTKETENSHTTEALPEALQTEPSSLSAFDLSRTHSNKMNARITFLLVPLLVVAVLSLDVDKGNFTGFQNQHIYTEMFDNMCTEVMKKRNITVKNRCKPINSLIRTDSNKAKSICKRDGTVTSDQLFDVVKCCLKRSLPKYPNCQYEGFFSRQKITVKCEKRLPVHFVATEKCRSEFTEFGYRSLE
ncbi:ribonuclease, liver-like [Synchiropus picturatus]